MQRLTLFLLSAVLTVALAEGQYYVPRAYYTIDAAGHESAPVPLRRLRRSLGPRAVGDNNANSQYTANASNGGSASAKLTSNTGNGWLPRGFGPAVGRWESGSNYDSAKPLRA